MGHLRQFEKVSQCNSPESIRLPRANDIETCPEVPGTFAVFIGSTSRRRHGRTVPIRAGNSARRPRTVGIDEYIACSELDLFSMVTMESDRSCGENTAARRLSAGRKSSRDPVRFAVPANVTSVIVDEARNPDLSVYYVISSFRRYLFKRKLLIFMIFVFTRGLI